MTYIVEHERFDESAGVEPLEGLVAEFDYVVAILKSDIEQDRIHRRHGRGRF